MAIRKGDGSAYPADPADPPFPTALAAAATGPSAAGAGHDVPRGPGQRCDGRVVRRELPSRPAQLPVRPLQVRLSAGPSRQPTRTHAPPAHTSYTQTSRGRGCLSLPRASRRPPLSINQRHRYPKRNVHLKKKAKTYGRPFPRTIARSLITTMFFFFVFLVGRDFETRSLQISAGCGGHVCI